MLVIYANTDSTVFFDGLDPFDYYLLKFKQPNCVELIDIAAPDENCNDGVLTLNVTFPMGVYEVDVYGQSDYSNVSVGLATYIRTETIRVYNPAEICWASGVLTDEFNYPLDDENEQDLTD
ncbi:hypothetical protein UFOVP1615_13 [uncultured Caudovirales phage]|uniref:Uncharacterized protein n=1 Tax=uncultured Caudovirales phage TaxID=2100421 RepID=A0A6J5SX24_9CAUD|nr:hypothetical protein UFOVP1615_13 [uncultured Caudovirales phage]